MEIKEAIEVLERLRKAAEYYINEPDKQALQTAIAHLETLQKVKEAGGVERWRNYAHFIFKTCAEARNGIKGEKK